MLAAWNEIVGEFFSQHSRPARLVNGVLYVLVLQPTVLYELDRRWKGMILEKIRVRFGFRLCSIPRTPKRQEKQILLKRSSCFSWCFGVLGMLSDPKYHSR